MKKKRRMVVGVVSLAVAAAVTALALTVIKRPATATYVNNDQGIKLTYQKDLELSSLSEDDKENKIILRLNRNEPATLITVRYEEGFQALAAATKQEPLDLILSTLSKRYPGQFPGYKKLEENRIKISDRDALEIIFTYTGAGEVPVKQRFIAVMKDSNKAFYIAAQAAENKYDDISKELDQVTASIDIN